MRSPDGRGALTGVRVLDLTRLPPGGYCTVMLSDLGADVCRVDSPHQTGRTLAVGLSRGKRSVGIDLRDERSAEVLRRLAAWADVLVEGERPGAMDERGFAFADARAENPGLIWCSISGYGQDGPYATHSGHDLSYLAHSGMLAALDPELPWHPQGILAIPVGALMAVIGILAALRERDHTHEGCHLDISMSESATWLLSGSDAQVNGQPVDFPTGPDRHLYQCSDGRWVAVAAAEPRTWRALCEGLGLPDLIDTLHSWDDPSVVIARVASVFVTRPAADWVAELGPSGAAVVAANRGAELQDDPQLRTRNTLQAVGDVMVPRNPIRTRDAQGERPSLSSALSMTKPLADTRAVLMEAGFARDEIDALVAAGVVAELGAA